MIKVFEGTYLKKDGNLRTMKFVKISDLPLDFLKSISKGGNGPNLKQGFESVWDLEAKAFRVFNYNTLQNEIKVTEEKEDILSS